MKFYLFMRANGDVALTTSPSEQEFLSHIEKLSRHESPVREWREVTEEEANVWRSQRRQEHNAQVAHSAPAQVVEVAQPDPRVDSLLGKVATLEATIEKLLSALSASAGARP